MSINYGRKEFWGVVIKTPKGIGKEEARYELPGGKGRRPDKVLSMAG